MARQKNLERAACGLTPAELGDFLRAEPPAFLDALVKERMGSVLTRQRAELGQQLAETRRSPSGNTPSGNTPSGSTSGSISRAEAWTYAVGFVAYGVQLADGVAQMLWRALTG
ncbi:MAG: hypothetical protein ABI895_09850 [Deltaproteobacteria bacterium]